MPIITLTGPKLDIEKKKLLASEMSNVASEIMGIPIEAFTFINNEKKVDDVAIGGVLISDGGCQVSCRSK